MAFQWHLIPFLILLCSSVRAATHDQAIFQFPERVIYVGKSAGIRGIVPPVLPSIDLLSVDPSPGGFGEEESDSEKNARSGPRVTAGTSGQKVLFKRVAAGKPTLGFDGIDSYTQRYSGSAPKYNGTQNKNTPPDPSICVGNGFVMQTVNLALSVFNATDGSLLAGATIVNEFLHAKPMKVVNRATNTTSLGDAFADGSCLFDPATKRFFYTNLWLSGGQKNAFDVFGQTRSHKGVTLGSGLVVAASTTGDPRREWSIFFIPSTNDGQHSHNDSAPPLNFPHKASPFLADYPRTGMDSNGLFIGTNQFEQRGSGAFLAGCVYAVSKSRLLAPFHKKFSSFPATRFVVPLSYTDVFPGFTIRPLPPPSAETTSPYDTGRGGTAYFVSTMSNEEGGDYPGNYSRVAVWALTNTRLLDQSAQAQLRGLKLQVVLLKTPYYFDSNPKGASQKRGCPIPYAKSVNRSGCNLSTLDQRILGLTMHKGAIWAVFHTGIGKNLDNGFVVAKLRPSFAAGTGRLGAALEQWQVVGVEGQNLLDPAIAINSKGNGAIGFSISGSSYFPSAGYIALDDKGVLGDRVRIAAAGKVQLDDITAYLTVQGSPARFGDWNTAVVDENGSVWIVAEYVSAVRRTPRTNWATYIFKLDV